MNGSPEEQRAMELAIATSGEPLRQLPFDVCVTRVGFSKRLMRMVIRYNEKQFDHLTARGFRFNFLTETYEKIHG